MIKIATLGPANTFSEIAAREYGNSCNDKYEIELFPTISKAFSSVGKECSCAVLPIENIAEGYVSVVLDLLVHSDLSIVHELLLPIQFSFAANCKSIDAVKKVYAQFVTQGQCGKFLDKLKDLKVITTESNGTSHIELKKGMQDEGAIVPAFAVEDGDFPLIVPNIADRPNNQTRFITVTSETAKYDPSLEYKTTLVIIENVDRPGMLSDILSAFAVRNINLVSIMSRPTKETLGRYHFFIDIEGHSEEPRIKDALNDVQKENTVRLLGSFAKADPINEKKYKLESNHKKKTKRRSMPKNPFPMDSKKPYVYVTTGENVYKNTREALSKIDLSIAKGKRVLLKPNAGRNDPPETGITTNPKVVAAAIDAFQDAGAQVAIGESPITGVKAFDALKTTGIAMVANERDCPLIDLDENKPVQYKIKDGIAIQSLKICPKIFEFDVIVSIPVIKTHMHTVVTLSVKNMKGCLWRRSKVDLHMLAPVEGIDIKPLDIAIADMSSVLKPHLSIIDGSICMEGLGPRAGKIKKLDVVVASTDPFAADAVACSLMGIDAATIPHLKIGAERGYGIIDDDKILINPDSWRDLISPFELPPENLTFHFPGITILDEQSCSACQSTLLLFLERYGKEIFDYFPGQKNIDIAIGKGHNSVPMKTLCIGNCTVKHKKSGIFVSGCPPVSSEILKLLSGEDPQGDYST